MKNHTCVWRNIHTARALHSPYYKHFANDSVISYANCTPIHSITIIKPMEAALNETKDLAQAVVFRHIALIFC